MDRFTNHFTFKSSTYSYHTCFCSAGVRRVKCETGPFGDTGMRCSAGKKSVATYFSEARSRASLRTCLHIVEGAVISLACPHKRSILPSDTWENNKMARKTQPVGQLWNYIANEASMTTFLNIISLPSCFRKVVKTSLNYFRHKPLCFFPVVSVEMELHDWGLVWVLKLFLNSSSPLGRNNRRASAI
jgi:hypothetical protein